MSGVGGESFVMAPPERAAIPVADGGVFPVRRIFCVGQNYAAHAREMGGNPERDPPFFFTKPADAVLTGGAPIPYPPGTADLHHEIELVLAIGEGGADIAAERALAHVWGVAAGLDMTRRDMQAAAKAAGRPWDMAKGFDHSAPVGPVRRLEGGSLSPSGRIRLRVNGRLRQDAPLFDMIWSPAEIIAALSRLVRLAPGDLIFTGTPEGVAAVGRGDVLEGEVEGAGTVSTRIV